MPHLLRHVSKINVACVPKIVNTVLVQKSAAKKREAGGVSILGKPLPTSPTSPLICPSALSTERRYEDHALLKGMICKPVSNLKLQN